MTDNEMSRKRFLTSSLYCLGAIGYLNLESKLHKYRLSETRKNTLKELYINAEVSEILALTPNISFDREGNLLYTGLNKPSEKAVLMQTDNDLKKNHSASGRMECILNCSSL
jgi:hypothetical protein